MAEVFGQGAGLVQAAQLKNGYQYIIIKGGNAQVYFQQAPVTGIRIDQQVDFALAKTLAGNFNLVTFEDLPVTISIHGMINLYTGCGKSSDISSIAKLYKSSKAGTSSTVKPFSIVIGQSQYKAVIVAMTQQGTSETPGIMAYQLTMFGVRVK